MSHPSKPTNAADLVNLVASYLREDLRPSLGGRHKFLALVAANALSIVARELQLGLAADRRECDRLAHLFSRAGDLDSLNRDLCEALADGRMDEDTPELLPHLFASTMDRLAIDQPQYAAYRRELSEYPDGYTMRLGGGDSFGSHTAPQHRGAAQ
ncbi:hypothetical protein EBBID32_27510 [Sphingobium indicum BiD32]|uniref:DUF6285 domain-containing protein n=1 Tax=Sphingobium indicum BiD32 TaxID=1301087 RepID=N1MSJ9_9SPHN|nr:DUF6285 domain-containing protein [Sphingobium indicum]CCW18398.1 hypothetical protein EBBID32_27510 [Sphingobium indicum BiD32]